MQDVAINLIWLIAGIGIGFELGYAWGAISGGPRRGRG